MEQLRVKKDSARNSKGEFTIFILRGTEYIAVMEDEELAQELVDAYNRKHGLCSGTTHPVG
jgi:hypothetical protein